MQLTTASLIWLLAGVLLFILEMVLPGFVLFFFALGAWITAITSWLLPLRLDAQLAVFLVASVATLLCLRGFIRKSFFASKSIKDQDNVLAATGRKAVVIAVIEPPAEGKISYSGSSWRATAEEKIEAGQIVSIVEQNGLIMRVRKNDTIGSD